jgi:hypothetical protein
MMKIRDLFILLSGNRRKICIKHHFLSDIITAARLGWRVRHLRGKKSKSLISSLRLYVNKILPLLGFYALKIGSSETTFRNNIRFLSSRLKVFLNCLTLKQIRRVKVQKNVGHKLQHSLDNDKLFSSLRLQ